MSDIQDLIHKTSIDCIKQGERQATERIIKLVERFGFNEELGFSFEQAKEDLLTLIKGEK